eukprot:Protomagalhaensia_wolfi_Nauph_80__721@NODE_1410_length_1542_cov_405_388556_g1090_i0_p1_GENE_NODE_1410_length_1542_cov_405_388556_g1090_i0NODE_1410_length_1542_cov_405_388556_g1090_i0_p1_ORF_typecomplete_len248_score23_42_NODE_1410_length_1542_cov_405_388556_g1090_i0136879
MRWLDGTSSAPVGAAKGSAIGAAALALNVIIQGPKLDGQQEPNVYARLRFHDTLNVHPTMTIKLQSPEQLRSSSQRCIPGLVDVLVKPPKVDPRKLYSLMDKPLECKIENGEPLEPTPLTPLKSSDSLTQAVDLVKAVVCQLPVSRPEDLMLINKLQSVIFERPVARIVPPLPSKYRVPMLTTPASETAPKRAPVQRLARRPGYPAWKSVDRLVRYGDNKATVQFNLARFPRTQPDSTAPSRKSHEY